MTNRIATASRLGPASGVNQETESAAHNVTFIDPLDLPADHYFFVPQVLLNDPNQQSLSAPPTATPFDT